MKLMVKEKEMLNEREATNNEKMAWYYLKVHEVCNNIPMMDCDKCPLHHEVYPCISFNLKCKCKKLLENKVIIEVLE